MRETKGINLDIFSVAPQATPAEQPKKIFMTLTGTAAEMSLLRDALDKALASNGPVVFEYTTGLGIPVRVLIDRLGAPMQGN